MSSEQSRNCGLISTGSTPKALLRVAQGCNAKRATLGPGRKEPYPNGVIADRQRFGNNAFSVEKTGDNLNPG